MCLGVPGEIVLVREDGDQPRTGRVRFGPLEKDVCLAFVPEARAGDWVMVHAGFAIARLDEEEARRTMALLDEVARHQAPGEAS